MKARAGYSHKAPGRDGRLLVAAITLLLLALFVTACGQDEQEPVEPDVPAAGVEEAAEPTPEVEEPVEPTPEAEAEEMPVPATGEVSVGQILDVPDTFIGQQVTVNAEVGRIIGPDALTIETSDLLAEESLLVVGAGGAIPTEGLTEDDHVVVTGTVRQFVQAEVEDEFGIDLDDELVAEFEEQPYIAAETVEVVQAETEAGAAEPEVVEPQAPVTLGDITADPEAFYGETVTVNGAVNVLLGPQAFTIADPELIDLGEILVVDATGAEPETTLEEEDEVVVTGTVRQFVIADIESEFGIDLDDDLLVEYEDKPVIVASEINPITTLSDIVSDPAEYYGTTVTVSGDVNVVLGPQAFTIAEAELIDLGEILVVTTTATMPQEEDRVLVTGDVRQLVIAEIEDEFGIDLDDELLVEYEDKPVIVASAVTILNPAARADEAGTAEPAAAEETVGEILNEPDTFMGQQVTVNAEIGQIIGPNALTIEEAALGPEATMPVISAGEVIPTLGLTEDDHVLVTGTVRQFVLTEVEDELGIDLDDELFVEYEDRPYIAADAIEAVEPVE